MYSLLFYDDGVIKKLSLSKKLTTLGRDDDNDHCLKSEYISGHHLRIELDEDKIEVFDLDSRNGLYVKNRRVKWAEIRLNESFSLGQSEFYFKKGSLDEFAPAKELIPLFKRIQQRNARRPKEEATKYIFDIYRDTLQLLLEKSLKKESLPIFLTEVSSLVSGLPKIGSVYLVADEKDGESRILFMCNGSASTLAFLEDLVLKRDVFSGSCQKIIFPGKDRYSLFFPIQYGISSASLVYISTSGEAPHPRRQEFLKGLAREIEMVAHLNPSQARVPIRTGPDPVGEKVLIAKSRAMMGLIHTAKTFGPSDLFVLIQGESGTGKELFARLIHQHSSRSDKPFIALNCAAIPEDLLESELFGHERGSFTGAHALKIGKLEMVSGGTLVLDEIGDMPLKTQSKLLRAIQENEFYRIGGMKPISVNLRILSLSNQNMKKRVIERAFREDLYYRLVHRQIEIPPLREHREDIPALINHFTLLFGSRQRKRIAGYSIKVLKTLQEYSWPGNVRQLENEVRSLVNLCGEGELISWDMIAEDIRSPRADADPSVAPPPAPLSCEAQTKWLLRVLEKNGWNKTWAAKDIGMTYRGLQKKLKRLGIDRIDTNEKGPV